MTHKGDASINQVRDHDSNETQPTFIVNKMFSTYKTAGDVAQWAEG